VRHAIVQHQIRKIAEAQQQRLLAPQIQNLLQQPSIIERRLSPA
jgi:hypothetical protein